MKWIPSWPQVACRRRAFASRSRRAFTLMELLVVVAIMMVVAALSVPVLAVTWREVRINGAISRLEAGLQQTRALLTDYQFANRTNTVPKITGAKYAGTALVCRWNDLLQDYEIFYALSNQNAVDTSGSFLASQATPAHGYSPFGTMEPMTLGAGLRLAGLRRTGSGDGLELVPSPTGSFAICVDATGLCLAPAQRIYVNLQQAPTRGGKGAWTAWDTTMYDAGGANTGAYESNHVDPYVGNVNAGKGEGFLTSISYVIVYRDDDLPLTGQSPSGVEWRVPNPSSPVAGATMLNPALDPNELLAQTKGRLVLMTIQGGSVSDY